MQQVHSLRSMMTHYGFKVLLLHSNGGETSKCHGARAEMLTRSGLEQWIVSSADWSDRVNDIEQKLQEEASQSAGSGHFTNINGHSFACHSQPMRSTPPLALILQLTCVAVCCANLVIRSVVLLQQVSMGRLAETYATKQLIAGARTSGVHVLRQSCWF
jgi:hypothetical protein